MSIRNRRPMVIGRLEQRQYQRITAAVEALLALGEKVSDTQRAIRLINGQIKSLRRRVRATRQGKVADRLASLR